MNAWQITQIILTAHKEIVTNKKSLVKCLSPFLKRKNSSILFNNKKNPTHEYLQIIFVKKRVIM